MVGVCSDGRPSLLARQILTTAARAIRTTSAPLPPGRDELRRQRLLRREEEDDDDISNFQIFLTIVYSCHARTITCGMEPGGTWRNLEGWTIGAGGPIRERRSRARSSAVSRRAELSKK